ncbi:MAG: hypothetical protein SH809_15205 [Rhodothermales bacterium]|nr:hypothetical protein [Rhodothermales bacterium]
MKDAVEASGYATFLLAKRPIDERALNERIWACAMRRLTESPVDRPTRVLELGAGVGGMLERLLTRTTVRELHYTVVEIEPAHLTALRIQLCAFGEQEGYEVDDAAADQIVLTRDGSRVEVVLTRADVFSFLRQTSGATYDLLIAQAFLDLFEIEPLMTLLVAAVIPGGGLYFPITFDGISSWLPVIDAAFDQRVEQLYHRSMDLRGASIEQCPRSQTGRHVVYHLSQRPDIATVDAGGADWMVGTPSEGELIAGEAAYLYAMLNGYERELTGHPELDAERWQTWLTLRRRSIAMGTALFIAHHLDVFARRQFSGISRSRSIS